MLPANGEWKAKLECFDAFSLQVPGVYDIQITYYAQSCDLIENAPDDLRSNVFRIVVGERPSYLSRLFSR